jgi:hypothetical protein
MAFDELLTKNVGILTGHLSGAVVRWQQALNDARTPGYTFDDLFATMREQFVENWDTWNALMFGYSTVPTVYFNFNALALAGKRRSTVVKQRLTGFAFDKTPLEQFGGGNVIAPADYSLSVAGAFDGVLSVRIDVAAPAAGEYRGLVLGSRAPQYPYQPVAWVVVNAT